MSSISDSSLQRLQGPQNSNDGTPPQNILAWLSSEASDDVYKGVFPRYQGIPPTMKSDESHDHCIIISNLLKSELGPYGIKCLQNRPKAQKKIYKLLVQNEYLLGDGGIERLPIYVYIMGPLSRKVYLESPKAQKLPLKSGLHKLLYRASMGYDKRVSGWIQKWASGRIGVKKLKARLRKILAQMIHDEHDDEILSTSSDDVTSSFEDSDSDSENSEDLENSDDSTSSSSSGDDGSESSETSNSDENTSSDKDSDAEENSTSSTVQDSEDMTSTPLVDTEVIQAIVKGPVTKVEVIVKSSKDIASKKRAHLDSEDMPTSSEKRGRSHNSNSDSDSDWNLRQTISSALESMFSAEPTSSIPPHMAMQRDKNSHEYCVFMCDYMEENLSEDVKHSLKLNAKHRTALYKQYVRDGFLKPPKTESAIEQLPIYIFLMAPQTRQTYLNGFKDNKVPTGGDIFKLIFKASLINDEGVAGLLKKNISKELTGKELSMFLTAIKDGRDWKKDPIGVIRVKTLDEVPDAAFLVCFEKIPDFSQIQSKSINCVIIKPSLDSLNLISSIGGKGRIDSTAIGKSKQIFQFNCFGPNFHTPSKEVKLYGKLSSVFSAFFNNSRKLNEKIYVVDGFF